MLPCACIVCMCGMCGAVCGGHDEKNEVLSFFPFPFHFDLFQKPFISHLMLIFSFPWRNRAPRRRNTPDPIPAIQTCLCAPHL